MPKRIDGREGEGLMVNGVPVTVALARGREWTLLVGVVDADGFVESLDDCKAAARRLSNKIDNARRSRNDAGA